MKATKLATALLSLQGALALVTSASAQAPADILAAVGKFKPTLNFSDNYAEKVLTIQSERIPGEPREPATHEVIVKPQKISAKVVANLEGFSFSGAGGEIGDAMAVGVTVGGFEFTGTLGESKEAIKAGGFPAEGKKATFSYIGTFDKPNGDTYEKKVGTVSFSWTKTRLTVSISVMDIVAAGVGEIAASNYIGLYVDNSENGNHPSGSAKFANEPVAVAVTFGSAVGAQTALARGTSTTAFRRYGSENAGTLEEFPVESVKLTGKADPLAGVAN